MAPKKTTKDRGPRVEAYLGKMTYDVKGRSVTHEVVSRTFQDVIDTLNLKKPTEAQGKKKDGKPLNGYKGTKSIQILHPTKPKTAKGSTRVISLPVPGVAGISDIRKWLQGTKAKQFRIDGRWHSVEVGGK